MGNGKMRKRMKERVELDGRGKRPY